MRRSGRNARFDLAFPVSRATSARETAGISVHSVPSHLRERIMILNTWLTGWLPKKSSPRRKRRTVDWQVEQLEPLLLLSALTPAEVSHAYGVDKVMFGTVKGDGTGQTIAIVDAYGATNIN